MNDFGIKNMDQVAPVANSFRGTLKRQPAFDTFDGSLFAVLPSLSEEQTLQEVPTGLDSVSHGNLFSTLTDGAGLPSLGSRVNKDTRSVNRDRPFSSQECQYLEYWV
ncbi:v-ets erythroblastosis virus E26 oncogene homolog 2 (avian) (mapped), isoform CRA_f [Rattus norvegicus]|uniref:V-ets erythroblastosis virus E26 oncogene homolog 2 (Avian) (Mapped), isoform CRA_f n=1 Tax=Rattus norvegicus TaxID=10116 RepID=A6KPU2_RAT|nr:v-ets erythroblastosis virus E26 oncogene homolog 2 (avian) (mapped), isoform CRA_f [Rattus norvegicus]